MSHTDTEKTLLTDFCAGLPTFSNLNGWHLEKVESGTSLYLKQFECTGCEYLWPHTSLQSNKKADVVLDEVPSNPTKHLVHGLCSKTIIDAPADFIMNCLTEEYFLPNFDSRINNMVMIPPQLTENPNLFYMNMIAPNDEKDTPVRYAIVKQTTYKCLNEEMFDEDSITKLGCFLSDRCNNGIIARGVKRTEALHAHQKDAECPTDPELYKACLSNSICGGHVLLMQSVGSNYCEEMSEKLMLFAKRELRSEKAHEHPSHPFLIQALAPKDAKKIEVYPGTGFFVRELRKDEGSGSEVYYVMNLALHEDGSIEKYLENSIISIRNEINKRWVEDYEKKVNHAAVRDVEMAHYLGSPISGAVTPFSEIDSAPKIEENVNATLPQQAELQKGFHEGA